MKIERFLAIMAMGLLATVGARADAILSYQHMVTAGDAGNAADDTTYGSVAGVYQISKYEVTAGEYAAFLNAAAKSDPNGLYDGNMDSSAYGCQITRTGDDGDYIYDFSGRPSGAVSDWESRPVNRVSWYDAARYCNWLTTSNTESGVYNTSTWAIDRTYRNGEGQAYFIPTEDEWYKAAYYKGGSTNAGYWDYPTGSDTAPTFEAPPGGANSANYNELAVGSPYYRNNVGAFSSSDSAYGTFDQGGNLDEWNETLIGAERGVRGGAFDNGPAFNLQADIRHSGDPASGKDYRGFRVACIAVVEQPVLNRIDVSPSNTTLHVGEQRIFAAAGTDQFGYPMAFTPTWSASGGPIDGTGYYMPTNAGVFEVIAEAAGSQVRGTSVVTAAAIPITGITGGPPFVVTFPSYTTTLYGLQHRSSMMTGDWTKLPGDVRGVGGPMMMIDTNDVIESIRFYRLIYSIDP
jgi:sulfatase modifying factor 1